MDTRSREFIRPCWFRTKPASEISTERINMKELEIEYATAQVNLDAAHEAVRVSTLKCVYPDACGCEAAWDAQETAMRDFVDINARLSESRKGLAHA